MISKFTIAILAAFLFAGLNDLFADILNVPEDFETIQAGIDASQDTDTVLVQPGIYVENVAFGNKSIVVGSLTLTTGDPAYIDSTIIDGDSNGSSVVSFREEENREPPTPALSGFTIRNGRTDFGGGIYITNVAPHLTHLTVKNNEAEENGGGIYVTGRGDEEMGIVLTNVELDSNSASLGGGIACHEINSPVHIMNSIISNNNASNGGGFYFYRNDINLSDVQILQNHAGQFGGGGWCNEMSNVNIFNSSFSGNRASRGGGLILDECENGQLVRDVFTGNYVSGEGGGAYISGSLVELSNLTVSDNEAEDFCGGFVFNAGGTASISQCIFWNLGDVELGCRPGGIDNEIIVGYSLVQSGEEGVNLNDSGNLDWQEGNIDTDPLFVDPDNGDYHLTVDSPCIDSGSPESEPDPDGSRPDMGAYFYNQNLAPIVVNSIGDQIFDVDPGRAIFADLNDVFEDPNGDELGFSFRNAPEELHMGIDDASMLFFNPDEDFSLRGAEITIIAEDPFGETAEDSFLLTILSENDPPFLFPGSPPDSSRILENVILFQWTDEHPLPRTYSLHLRFLSERIDTTIVINNGASRMYFLEDVEATLRELGLFSLWDEVEIGEIIWWIVARDDINEEVMEERWRVFIPLPLSVEDNADQFPVEFQLSSPYPNPFNSTTTISYSLPQTSNITLQVYDISGRLLSQLLNGRQQAGIHSSTVKADRWASGLYFVRLEASGWVFTQKIMLVK
ncbi:MAG: T9SS type A sorting domain-containing protein [Calditrichaeota bacterium]|nr:T9SS type A sorting domain-containing protein [Calditrichota bacterium]